MGQEVQWSSLFIGLATGGAVGYSIALPLLRLYGLAALQTGRTFYAVAALACYLPVQVWLVLSATRVTRPRLQPWALAYMAVVIFSVMPVVGVGWVGMLYVLAALVLVGVRVPWSLVLFGALVAAPTPLTLILDHTEWAAYFTVGMLFFSVPLAVGIRLIRAARELQGARLVLAEHAVIRERLRIDREVRLALGDGLEAIAARGDRARRLAASDPPAAARELRGLVVAARRTLAQARQMVTRYRTVSLLAELETAATLLEAAGIHARLELPPGELSDSLDQRERAALRRDIARLLAGTAPASVTIMVTRREGLLRLELSFKPGAGKAEVALG